MANPETSISGGTPTALADNAMSAEGDAIAALRQLALTLAGRAGMSDALRHALLIAARLTDSTHATILLLDERSEQIRYRVTLESGNVAPLEMVAKPMMDKGLAGLVARERHAALVQDTEDDARWLPGPGLGDLRSAIVAPIMSGGHVGGVLTLGHERPGHYDDRHLDVAQIVAAQLALALAADLDTSYVEPDAVDLFSAGRGAPDLPRAGEIVALAAGMRGLNSAGDRLPPETYFDDILRAFFQAMAEAVALHDGVVDHLDSDGLLAAFAGADSPPAAVQAALEMQSSARRLAACWRGRFGIEIGTVDIGVARGQAVIGRIGGGRSARRTAGGVVDQATRLRELARGGEILVSANVAEALTADVACAVAALPPLRLGPGAPQQIFNVGAPGSGRPTSSVGFKTSNRY